MDRLNFKKLLPGIVSIIIIAGMAVQSFATNVDMAAFVKKDKYMTKYYELDWRIDDIEQTLERLYKFTCTNVRSFGGAYNHAQEDYLFSQNSYQQTYHWSGSPVADLSEEGYLRVAPNDIIHWFGNHKKTDRFVKKVPASLLRWRDGVELYPNTTVRTVVTRTSPSGATASQRSTYTIELVMGPFKKFPHITTGAGSMASTIFVGDGFINSARNYRLAVYYAYDKDTEPTSWTAMSTGELNFSAADVGNGNFPASLQKKITMEDIEEVSYSGDYKKALVTPAHLYPITAFSTDLSNYDKLWIRGYVNAGAVANMEGVDFKTLTITSWNYNK